MTAPDGDRAYGLTLLDRAETLAGRHPAVRAAKRAWLESVRAQHEAEGQARLAQARPGAAELLLSASLTEARQRLLGGQPELAALALRRAADLAAGHRALVERTARRADLDDALLQQLTLRIFPGWPSDLTPARDG